MGSAKCFGVSMELGAFLAGLAVGRSEFAARAAGDALPMRDAFAVLFFVSVGMLFNPLSLVKSPLLIGVVLVVVVVIKPLATLFTVRLLGIPLATAIPVGAAFSQVGEFSFILGTVARGLGLLDDAGWNALVAVSIVSIALNPSIYGWGPPPVGAAGQGRAAYPEPALGDRPRPLHLGRLRTGRKNRSSAFNPAGRRCHGDRPQPGHGAATAS